MGTLRSEKKPKPSVGGTLRDTVLAVGGLPLLAFRDAHSQRCTRCKRLTVNVCPMCALPWCHVHYWEHLCAPLTEYSLEAQERYRKEWETGETEVSPRQTHRERVRQRVAPALGLQRAVADARLIHRSSVPSKDPRKRANPRNRLAR